MSKKSDLKRAISESEAEIESLEKKRVRSQSALLEAFLKGSQPSESDVEYFKIYTQLIELERKNLRSLKDALNSLE